MIGRLNGLYHTKKGILDAYTSPDVERSLGPGLKKGKISFH